MKKLKPSISILLVATISIYGALPSVWAANFNQQEYQGLLNKASQKQFVRVLVNLNVDVPLTAPSKQDITIKNKLAKTETALLGELDGNFIKQTLHRNNLGQVTLYVSPNGLKALAASKNVRGIFREPSTDLYSAAFDPANYIGDIEDTIARNGYADIEVDLNVENFDFDIDTSGRSVPKNSGALESELKSILPALHAELPESGVYNLGQLKANTSNPPTQGATQTFRVNAEGLYVLADNSKIRGVRLAGSDLRRPAVYDPDALNDARKNGFADVIVQLQPPAGYTPKQGLIPARAWDAQAKSLRRTLVDILSKFDAGSVTVASEFFGLGAAQIHLNQAAAEQLFKNPDPRIWRVVRNKPVAYPTLAESTALMNLPQAWNIGHTASGQYIAVLDTGIEKTHPFLQSSSGQSKVVYEACFGTTSTFYDPGSSSYINSVTRCPSPDSAGDSPLGLSDSAAPCTAATDSACFHGTHVAGIAAGKRSWNGLTGVAPDAGLIAIDVFSLLPTKPNGYRLAAFTADIAKALQTIDSSGLTQVTVNLSLGGGKHLSGSSCDSENSQESNLVTQLVQNLKSKNVAVVAATGNDSYRDGIAWPACISNVVKVAAIDDQLAAFVGVSNVADPANFVGPFFLAPGSYITSSGLSGSSQGAVGTSQAAPHVAGVYALVKAAVPGASWTDITNWISANAIPVNYVAGFNSGTFKRVYMPNL